MGKFGGTQKLHLRTVRTACLAILVLVFAGCAGSSAEGAGGDTGPRGNGGTGGAPECTSSDPCDAPQVCEPVTQTCVTPFAPCASQAECTGGTYCEETADLCLPSSVGTPCAGPDNCNGECLSGFCGCSGVAHEREIGSSPLDIYLVLDRTGSMGTDPGRVMGTIGYMSPEQVRGEPVDNRTDIFALGCLLHELLCDQRAFPGNSDADVATGIISRQPPPLRETGCDVPIDVQPIVDRCLEKSPAKRFQNASDLSFALRSLTTGSGSQDPTPTPRLFRGWRPAAAAVIVVMAAAGAVILRGNRTTEVPAETSSGLNPRLVAVAPFENRTGRGELDNLGLVAADWLSNTLARIDGIDVVPIGLGVESRAGSTSPQEVADATGAGTVVTGAYYLEGETLRFQANLTDATHGSLLRSLDPSTGPVDQPMASIESLGSEVAGAVASLFSSWDQGFDESIGPPSFEAYQEYVAGMSFFAVDKQKALEHFRRAAEIDPDLWRHR